MDNFALKVNLYSHQKEGIKNFIVSPYGTLNKSEPGTGKTFMAIGALNVMRKEGMIRRVLIVCPNSLKFNWSDEFKKSELEWPIHVLDNISIKNAEKLAEMASYMNEHNPYIIITNYEALPKLVMHFNKLNLDCIIADECHQIKNPRAKRSKALKAIKAKYHWAMTGTPIINKPLDIWSIVDWIQPGHFSPNFYAFRARYADIYTGAGFPMIKKFKNLPELKQKIDAVSWGFKKQECLDLPEKQFITRRFDLSKEERSVYDAMAKEMVAELGDDTIAASTALVRLLRLHQITGGSIGTEEGPKNIVGRASKIDSLCELLEELEGHKVVVWAHFKQDIMNIEAWCRHMKRPFYTLKAEDDIEERNEAVRRFQDDERDVLMIGSIAIGGVGITLTSASHCIYYSNSWSLGDRLQSQDRIHRIGQKDKCTYYDLVAKDTIDEYIIKCLTQKEKMADTLTRNDIKRIAYNI